MARKTAEIRKVLGAILRRKVGSERGATELV